MGLHLTRLSLAIGFNDFYRQHLSGFHVYTMIIMSKSFNLMRSTSFVVYLIVGTHLRKCWNGRNPRPVGLALRPFMPKFNYMSRTHKSNTSSSVLINRSSYG